MPNKETSGITEHEHQPEQPEVAFHQKQISTPNGNYPETDIKKPNLAPAVLRTTLLKTSIQKCFDYFVHFRANRITIGFLGIATSVFLHLGFFTYYFVSLYVHFEILFLSW